MLTGLLVMAMVVLSGFPETATARWLDRALTAVVAALGRIERRHLIFLILMTVILVAGAELLAMGGPLDAGLIAMWDVSTYLDIVLTTVVVAGATRGVVGWRAIVGRFAPRRAARARRRRIVRNAVKPANEDDRPLAVAA
jgi:hypothetical protein